MFCSQEEVISIFNRIHCLNYTSTQKKKKEFFEPNTTIAYLYGNFFNRKLLFFELKLTKSQLLGEGRGLLQFIFRNNMETARYITKIKILRKGETMLTSEIIAANFDKCTTTH